MHYHMVRKFDGEFNLTVWWFDVLQVITVKLISINITFPDILQNDAFKNMYVMLSISKPRAKMCLNCLQMCQHFLAENWRRWIVESVKWHSQRVYLPRVSLRDHVNYNKYVYPWTKSYDRAVCCRRWKHGIENTWRTWKIDCHSHARSSHAVILSN